MTHQTLVDDLQELERDLEANNITESLPAWGADVVRRALAALTGQEGAAPSPQSTDEKKAGLLGTAAGKSGDGSTPRRED